jgi:hypothetical protein
MVFHVPSTYRAANKAAITVAIVRFPIDLKESAYRESDVGHIDRMFTLAGKCDRFISALLDDTGNDVCDRDEL